MSRAELSRISGVSRDTLEDVEAGRVNLSFDTLDKISNGLKMSMADLLDGF